MTFLLDHDVPADMVRILEREGHSAKRLVEVLPRNSSDLETLRCATTHGWLLITCNRRDFLALAQTETHLGIIILIRRKTRQAEFAHLLTLLRRAGEAGLRGNINFA